MLHSSAPLARDANWLTHGIPEDRLALLQKLAVRVQLSADEAGDSSLPAGFTYLGQIVAHDMTQLIDPFFAVRGRPGEISTAREWPLCLETLYGDGPSGTPMIYERSGKVSLFGRTGRLRLGATRSATRLDEIPDLETHRDIPRLGCPVLEKIEGAPAPKPTIPRPGLPVPFDGLDDRFPGFYDQKSLASEPLLADQRNDDNLLVSQLLTVFIRLHNKLFDEARDQDGASPIIAFKTAREATIAVYQECLLEEYFPRILNEKVWEHYKARKTKDRIPDTVEKGKEFQVSPLFKHGAFRIGHSMINKEYRTRRLGLRTLGEFLDRETVARQRRLPISEHWVIDFAGEANSFFDKPGQPATNRTRQFCPSNTAELNAKLSDFASGLGLDPEVQKLISLTFVDYLRSERTAPSSVKQIREKLTKKLFPRSAFFHDLAAAKAEMEAWLQEDVDAARYGFDFIPFTEHEAKMIAENPPIPFAVQFEARLHRIREEAESDNASNVDRMGPLGSALIARTVAPILRHPRYAEYREAGLANAQRLLALPADSLGCIGSVIEALDAPDQPA